MKKTILSLSIITMLFATSCSNEADEIQNITNEKKETIEVATRNNTSSALKNIQNYIKNGKFGGADTRSLKNITIDPYVIDGDTAMYIANYGNGWELFSTDQRTPLIMASAETGSLDMNDENLPPALKANIFSIAKEIHQLKQIENEDNSVNPEWMIYPEERSELSMDEVASTNEQYEPGVGHWELINSITLNVAENTSNKLTPTHWHQRYPWNYYIPYAKDTTNYQGPSGCNPVGIAQYLYYLHSNFGKPTKAVSKATLTNSSTNKYTFSNETSSAWSNMAINNSGTTNGKRLVAMLIASIGQKTNTTYKKKEATTNWSNVISYLNNESGFNFISTNYESSYLINRLQNNIPVLMVAVNTNGNEGHTFIVDRLITKETTYRDYYGWVGTTSTGENANYIDESNGHIIGYKIKKEEIRTQTNYTIKINWGWDKNDNGQLYDDIIVFNPYTYSDWSVNGYHFNSKRKMAVKMN